MMSNSVRQRRRELINEHEDDFHGSDTDSGDMPETQVPETQEEEGIYRVRVDDDTPRVTKAVQNPARRSQQRSRLNLQTNARPGSSDEDKLQLLEVMTGVSRNNEDVPKLLGSGPSYRSPHSGGLSSDSPSSVGSTGELWAPNCQ
ncbi:unnamed protein product [Thlaspi arvense]|uniref:Uncharacterized protein n=1 Tax=Thlaspi arvense TaxID=13288 RepID=A0AAU9RT19_THLAR|nr:unnamed protein product [Thlaspi arvense]